MPRRQSRGPPDQAKFADGMKIVEGQFEFQWQWHEIPRTNTFADVSDVRRLYGRTPICPAEKYHRTFGNSRSAD
jgi:hypothetical protein